MIPNCQHVYLSSFNASTLEVGTLGKVHTLPPQMESQQGFPFGMGCKRQNIHRQAVDLTYGGVDSAYGHERQINGLGTYPVDFA